MADLGDVVAPAGVGQSFAHQCAATIIEGATLRSRVPGPRTSSTRRLIGSVAAVLLVVGAGACTSSSSWAGEATTTPERTLEPPDASAPLLFVARSDSGSLDVRDDGDSTLELDDVDAVTWFTDRPARDAGATSVTDALKTFGWERNGDRLSDDAPNGVLVATELGADSIVVELLAATVDGHRVRFTVAFVNPPPKSSQLTDIELFIDDAPAGTPTTTPSGLQVLETGGIVLGETVDGSGQTHTQVLQLPTAVEQSITGQQQLLAVVSGTTTYSMSGDAAVDDWCFSVDPTVTGPAAPIVVLKSEQGRLVDLAKDPNGFAAPGSLIDDLAATTAELNSLIAFVISASEGPQPDGALYTPLARILQDPSWTGTLIFNASVSTLPTEVDGRSTAALANAAITAVATGFTSSAQIPGPPTSFFGTIDHPGSAPGSAPATNGEFLRALFTNSALTSFDIGS
ncbi:hypothetical protein BH10ACT3_BH10ACT3_01180 [soil metagenome]